MLCSLLESHTHLNYRFNTGEPHSKITADTSRALPSGMSVPSSSCFENCAIRRWFLTTKCYDNRCHIIWCQCLNLFLCQIVRVIFVPAEGATTLTKNVVLLTFSSNCLRETNDAGFACTSDYAHLSIVSQVWHLDRFCDGSCLECEEFQACFVLFRNRSAVKRGDQHRAQMKPRVDKSLATLLVVSDVHFHCISPWKIVGWDTKQ